MSNFRTPDPLQDHAKCSSCTKSTQTHPLSTLPDLLVRFQDILGTSGEIEFWRKFQFFFGSNFFFGAGGKKHGFSGFFNLATAQIFDTKFSGTSRLRRSTQNFVGFLLRPFSGRVVGLNPYSLKVSPKRNTFAIFPRRSPAGIGINPKLPFGG